LQNSLDTLRLFWDESSTYVFIYAVYALIVCAVVLLIETRKGSNTSFYQLGLSNAMLALLAIALFAMSLLASQWLSKYIGGEISSFVITLVVSSLALFFAKAYFIDLYAVNYASSLLPGITVSAILLAPYTLFTLFVFLLASGMRN
jgi:hypothetical protein